MSVFKIDIDNALDNCNQISDSFNNYKESIESLNLMFENINIAWNDDTSYNFKLKTKINKTIIDEYNNNFLKRFNEINNFLINIKTILKKYENYNNFSIYYNSDNILDSLNIIDQFINYISKIKELILEIYIPDEYLNKNKLVNTLNLYQTISGDINNIKDSIKQISFEIQSELDASNHRVYELDDMQELKLQDFNYISKI